MDQALLKIHTNPAPKLNHPEEWSHDFNDFLSKALNTNVRGGEFHRIA